MESTILNLLTRDGVVTVVIVPPLESDHYSELYDLVCHQSEDADQLRTAVRTVCERWGSAVRFS